VYDSFSLSSCFGHSQSSKLGKLK
jgi:hypothetical protein